MPYFFAGLAWFFGIILTKFVFRAIFALGIGFGFYSGLSWVLDQLILQIQANISGLPAGMVDMFKLLRLDEAISIILSSYGIVAFLASSRVLLRRLGA